MSKQKLILISGGKIPRGGGRSGGGGGPPPTSRSRRRGRRPNPLNHLLWHATSRTHYAQRANSVENIAERMTLLSNQVMGRHINIAVSTANELIDDCRRRKLAYGWFPLHVQKGSIGYKRGYATVLTDLTGQDEVIYLLDQADIVFGVNGLMSSVRTIESMIKNDVDGVGFMIQTFDATGGTATADRLRVAAELLREAAIAITAARREIETL